MLYVSHNIAKFYYDIGVINKSIKCKYKASRFNRAHITYSTQTHTHNYTEKMHTKHSTLTHTQKNSTSSRNQDTKQKF